MNLFDLSKKKVEPQATVTTTEPQAFEAGKERTFRDPRTGEFISQRSMSEEQRKLIVASLQKNTQCASQSIQLSRQFVAIQRAILANDDAITATEKEINESMQKVRDEQKLDKQWGLNPQLMILEKRVPPEG